MYLSKWELHYTAVIPPTCLYLSPSLGATIYNLDKAFLRLAVALFCEGVFAVLFCSERNRPLAGCEPSFSLTELDFVLHLFSAVCGETCAHLVFIIHYKAAPPPLAVRLFK